MKTDWSHLAPDVDLQCEQVVTARVEPKEIGYVTAILEGHEGLAIMRTADPMRGIVCFWVPNGQRGVFDEMIEGLREEISVTLIAADDPVLKGLPIHEWEQGSDA